MKIICVLAILSTLYSNSQALKCQATADYSNVNSLGLAEKDCAAETKCSRPIFDGTNYKAATEAIKWGCASECTEAASCLSCEGADNCNVAVTFECFTKADKSTQIKCPDKTAGTPALEDTCVRPKVKDQDGTFYQDSDGTKWGCNACTAADKCTPCTGTTLCNGVAPPTYLCLKYETDENNVWGKKGVETDTCQTEVSTGCNMPAPDAERWGPKACGNVCGDTTCKKCDTASCNDIAVGTKYCKKGAAATAVGGLKSHFCDTAATKCKRPAISYGAVVTGGEDYGCGDCVDTAKCKGCETEANDCNKIMPIANHKCYSWTFTASKWTKSEASADCNAGDDAASYKCNMPKDLDTEAGFTSTSGCGPCKPDETAACKEVTSEGSHQCYKWTWDDAKKWTPSTEVGECYGATTDADKKCNLPKDRSKKEGYTSSGCGACKEAEKDGCLTVAAKMNVGQKAVISLLALLLPLLYVML